MPRRLPPMGTLRLVAFAAGVLTPVSSVAAPVTYVFEGIASGAFLDRSGPNSRDFTDTPFRLVAIGDTEDIVHFSSPVGGNLSLHSGVSATISVDGGPAAAFADNIRMFVNRDHQVIGVNAERVADLIRIPDQTIPRLNGYDLTTSLDTLTTDAPDIFISRVFTNLGFLSIHEMPTASVTVTVVPEPSALVVAIATAVGCFVRQRQISSAQAGFTATGSAR